MQEGTGEAVQVIQAGGTVALVCMVDVEDVEDVSTSGLSPEELGALMDEPLGEAEPITAAELAAWWADFGRGLAELWPKIAAAMDAFVAELVRSGREAIRLWAELWAEAERLDRVERRAATRRATARARLAAQVRQGYPGYAWPCYVQRHKRSQVRQLRHWRRLEDRAGLYHNV